METFFLGENKHEYPTDWEDLTPSQFVHLIYLYNRYLSGLISFLDLQLLFTIHIFNVKPLKTSRKKKMDLYTENLSRLSALINFYINIHYPNQNSLNTLSPETKKLLLKNPPHELADSNPEKRLAIRLQYEYKFSTSIYKNLIPEITTGAGQTLKGYTFNIIDGIIHTSITAAQFISAQTIIHQLVKQPNSVHLYNLLCATLYQRKKYTDENSISNANKFINVNIKYKQAILFNFNCIQEFIVTRTKYKILFTGDKTEQPGNKKQNNNLVGFKNTIYSLAKAGHGTSAEISKDNIFDYLDKTLYELQSRVLEMHRSKKKNSEIANVFNLSIYQVNELIKAA